MLAATARLAASILQQQVIPTELEAMSGFVSLQHRIGVVESDAPHARRARQQDVDEAFGWADASPSPTLGRTPAWLGGVSNTHAFGSRVLHEANVGYYNLQNTRISKYRDILNSTLGINNPLEHAIGGLAALMPTIDINTQRNSGGIGNAWDFWDIQRVWSVSDRWSRASSSRHTLQAGVEYRRINLEGEYMARTNGDLDYDNWVFFFTGHGAAGGGSDLDQGDTRRNFFAQRHRRLRAGRLAARRRADGERRPPLRHLRQLHRARTAGSATTTCRTSPRSWACEPGFQVPGNAPFFSAETSTRCRSASTSIPARVDRSEPDSRGEVRHPPSRGDYNNVAPRVGFAWQPPFAPKVVVRGGWGIYYERTGASYKRDLQLSAPFFSAERAGAAGHGGPVSAAQRQPVPDSAATCSIGRGRQRRSALAAADGTPFPGHVEPFTAKSNVFIDPLLRTPYLQQWTTNVQYELRPRHAGRRRLRRLARRGSARQDQPGGAGRSARARRSTASPTSTTGSGASSTRTSSCRPQFLGLNRNGGLPAADQHRTVHVSQLPDQSARENRDATLTTNVAYTLSRSMDTLSSDGGLVEHDPRRPENNFGPSDYDRPIV